MFRSFSKKGELKDEVLLLDLLREIVGKYLQLCFQFKATF